MTMLQAAITEALASSVDAAAEGREHDCRRHTYGTARQYVSSDRT
jgi:hypothetical protein